MKREQEKKEKKYDKRMKGDEIRNERKFMRICVCTHEMQKFLAVTVDIKCLLQQHNRYNVVHGV